MDGILTRNSTTSAVPQQVQRVRRKAALSARAIVSAAARGEPMIIPDDLTRGSGSHCSGYQSSMEDRKKSFFTTTTAAAAVASTSTYIAAAASASVTLASVDHRPPSSDSIVSSLLLLPAAASHSLSRPTIIAAARSASSPTGIGSSGSGSDAGSDYSSSGVTSNNTSSSSSSSASSSSNNKKKTALSAHAVEYLKNWMMSPEHVDHPYPTEDEKLHIMNETGIVLKQLTNWFVNNRKRYWKPKVEELRRRQEGNNIVGDGGEETRSINMDSAGGCGGDGNNRNVLIRSSSPEEQGSNTSNKRQLSTWNTKKRSSNNKDDGLLLTAKKTRNSNSSSITDGTTIITPTPTTTMLLPLSMTAPSYLPSLRDDMKMNITRVNGTNRSGTNVVSDESGSGRGSGTEEESGDDIDDDIQHVSNPLFDKSGYSSLDVMESSPSSDNELRTAHQQVMNMIDMDYSFNPLNMEDTITTYDNQQQQQQEEEEEHICGSILPHSCTDPNNRSIQPCALCSACRDWNLGEFCPWDLTGILGDLSTDHTMLQDAEGSESMIMVKTTTTAGVANDVVPIFSDEDGSSNHNCETISTEEGEEEVEEGGTTFVTNDTTTTSIEPTMMFTSMYSNLSVPKEISHSTSAMNFMADIESWD